MTLVPDIKMRTNDERYMRYVEIYFNQLFKKIKHLLRGNGGPIIMVQVLQTTFDFVTILLY